MAKIFRLYKSHKYSMNWGLLYFACVDYYRSKYYVGIRIPFLYGDNDRRVYIPVYKGRKKPSKGFLRLVFTLSYPVVLLPTVLLVILFCILFILTLLLWIPHVLFELWEELMWKLPYRMFPE